MTTESNPGTFPWQELTLYSGLPEPDTTPYAGTLALVLYYTGCGLDLVLHCIG